MSDREQILVETRGSTRLITLNRPEKLNAWTRQMNLELIDAIDEANADSAIAAIVVTGSGRGFCAGADIESAFHSRLQSGGQEESADRPKDWVSHVRDSKPLIAAINGVAVGVGVTMVLPFDILIASEEAKIGMFFVRMGLVPELASSHFLVQRVGWAMASEMCLTGRLYPASELKGTGLVNDVVPADQLLDRALEMADQIAQNPDSSLRMIKSLLTTNSSSGDLADVQRREMDALHQAYESSAHKEAVSAFLEKRKPVFRPSADAS